MLIRERHSFDSSAYFNFGGNTEVNIENLSEARTRYAQFNIKYVYLELLYEHSFKSIPTLTSWSRSYFLSDTVLISLYIKHRNKGGVLICKYPN